MGGRQYNALLKCVTCKYFWVNLELKFIEEVVIVLVWLLSLIAVVQ